MACACECGRLCYVGLGWIRLGNFELGLVSLERFGLCWVRLV
jgi:hypothetical protein